MRARTARLATIGALALSLVGAEAVALAPQADAAHHLVRIRQVFPGGPSPATGVGAEFVVLQLTAAGENQFFTGPGTATVRLYEPDMQTNFATFTMNPPNGENQRTVLVATAEAQTAFGVTADLLLPPMDALNPTDGAVCFDSSAFGGVDCVEWGGNGAGATMLPSLTGTHEPAFNDDNVLQRSIAAGCPTLHEFGEDTDDSAADFSPVAITPMTFTPRNNAAPIQETPCGGGGGAVTPTNPATTTPATTPPKKCKKGQKLKKGKCVKKKRKKR